MNFVAFVNWDLVGSARPSVHLNCDYVTGELSSLTRTRISRISDEEEVRPRLRVGTISDIEMHRQFEMK